MVIKKLTRSSKIYLSDNSFIENIAFGKEIEKIDKNQVELAAKKSQIHDLLLNQKMDIVKM